MANTRATLFPDDTTSDCRAFEPAWQCRQGEDVLDWADDDVHGRPLVCFDFQFTFGTCNSCPDHPAAEESISPDCRASLVTDVPISKAGKYRFSRRLLAGVVHEDSNAAPSTERADGAAAPQPLSGRLDISSAPPPARNRASKVKTGQKPRLYRLERTGVVIEDSTAAPSTAPAMGAATPLPHCLSLLCAEASSTGFVQACETQPISTNACDHPEHRPVVIEDPLVQLNTDQVNGTAALMPDDIDVAATSFDSDAPQSVALADGRLSLPNPVYRHATVVLNADREGRAAWRNIEPLRADLAPWDLFLLMAALAAFAAGMVTAGIPNLIILPAVIGYKLRRRSSFSNALFGLILGLSLTGIVVGKAFSDYLYGS